MQSKYLPAAAAAAMALGAPLAQAACTDLPDWTSLKTALTAAVAAESSGLDLQMWATLVDRDGVVCAVAFSGTNRGAQWLGSRVISAQKANTANAFSLDGLALSTANLYSAVQPGGSLFGLQHSNPVNTDAAYGGTSADNGTATDFMVGKKIGGVNVFGGGLALYNPSREVVGAVGVSGDTSCADHMIGWRVRDNRRSTTCWVSVVSAGIPRVPTTSCTTSSRTPSAARASARAVSDTRVASTPARKRACQPSSELSGAARRVSEPAPCPPRCTARPPAPPARAAAGFARPTTSGQRTGVRR